MGQEEEKKEQKWGVTSVRVLPRLSPPDPTMALKYHLCPLNVPTPGKFAPSIRDWIRDLGKGRVMC